MRALKSRKAMVFTVAAALFAVVLFSVVAVRVEQSREYSEATAYRVRCDELNAFLTDIEKDLARATRISGKRAASYAVGLVVFDGAVIEDSALAVEEMVSNGSLYGDPVPTLENQTLPYWVAQVNTLAMQRKFTSNLNESLIVVQVTPHTAWDFWVRTQIKGLFINDTFGYCSFSGTLPRFSTKINADVSVVNLEDPLYALNSNGYASRLIVQSDHSTTNHAASENLIEDLDNHWYHGTVDGPSFLERLEGMQGDPTDATRHAYYVNLAYDAMIEEGLNITLSNVTIGLETFVDVAELQGRVPSQSQYLYIKQNQTTVDHVYFGSQLESHKVVNVSSIYSWFRLDDDHISTYNLSAEQVYD